MAAFDALRPPAKRRASTTNNRALSGQQFDIQPPSDITQASGSASLAREQYMSRLRAKRLANQDAMRSRGVTPAATPAKPLRSGGVKPPNAPIVSEDYFRTSDRVADAWRNRSG